VILAYFAWWVPSLAAVSDNWSWSGCWSIFIASGVGLFLWFLARRDPSDWIEPLSFSKPFFPMRANPARFWTLAAISLALGGAIALARDLSVGLLSPGAATFFLWGAGIGVALVAARALTLRRIG
jgi:hypothetical protein